MPALSEPVPRETAVLLRRATLEFVVSERRRVFPPVLRIGDPTGPHVAIEVPSATRLDHGLRSDLAAAALSRALLHTDMPLCWLTRPGALTLHDEDAAWLPCARTAFDEADVPFTMVVVTRRGWFDPRSGVCREWRRLRRR